MTTEHRQQAKAMLANIVFERDIAKRLPIFKEFVLFAAQNLDSSDLYFLLFRDFFPISSVCEHHIYEKYDKENTEKKIKTLLCFFHFLLEANDYIEQTAPEYSTYVIREELLERYNTQKKEEQTREITEMRDRWLKSFVEHIQSFLNNTTTQALNELDKRTEEQRFFDISPSCVNVKVQIDSISSTHAFEFSIQPSTSVLISESLINKSLKKG